MPYAPQLADQFLPGMGPDKTFVIGSTNLGVSIIDATLAMNTAQTHAQLIASPPNTSSALAVGPVVHSLGVPPAFAIAQALQNSLGPVNYVFITADNSAVYFDPRSHTNSGQGVRTRIIAFR